MVEQKKMLMNMIDQNWKGIIPYYLQPVEFSIKDSMLGESEFPWAITEEILSFGVFEPMDSIDLPSILRSLSSDVCNPYDEVIFHCLFLIGKVSTLTLKEYAELIKILDLSDQWAFQPHFIFNELDCNENKKWIMYAAQSQMSCIVDISRRT